jgi:dienelactone hydrolase
VYLTVFLAGVPRAAAQSEPAHLAPILKEEILPPMVAEFEVKEHVMRHAVNPPNPTSAAQWTAESARLRARLVATLFHGWPPEVVNAPPRFEDLGVFATEKGYRLRKLRYEIVPGFYSTAVLYEPENMQGKMPAILNVNGHDLTGKAAEYKQKRCITFAQHGILALNIEWLGMGELRQRENDHWFGAHLNLVGANGTGLFYLAMRRGVDYLYNHPNVDRTRLGLTGLSGGGWQTITLSSLDERVTAAAEVAGFSAIRPKMEVRRHADLGDLEQSPVDFFTDADFPDLVALRAPRPTLLVHNAEDDCCFRAPVSKPLNYDIIKPIYRLYGKEDALGWHENTDPSTHNYHLDNRTQVYHFFAQAFGLPAFDEDAATWADLKTYDEMAVGLPADNLTILGLARKDAAAVSRAPVPAEASERAKWAAGQRETLRHVVRYEAEKIAENWTVATSKHQGVETFSHLFRLDNGLSAEGVLVRAIAGPAQSPATIVLDDRGRAAAVAAVSDRVNRGERVLALDLFLQGQTWNKNDDRGDYPPPEGALYAQYLNTLGERPLGIESAQLVAIARWLRAQPGVTEVRLECTGIRNQTVVLVAAALEPQLFSHVVVHEGMKSLGYLLAKPVEYDQAPDLFCLDLYKEFDLDQLQALAANVKTECYVEDAAKEKSKGE